MESTQTTVILLIVTHMFNEFLYSYYSIKYTVIYQNLYAFFLLFVFAVCSQASETTMCMKLGCNEN